jgi:ubiquinone/menaquinone biosynthesis C-methylase UbiE
VNSDRVAVRDAFNLHAPAYDERFAHSAAGQAMRQAVWDAADKVLPAGARLLDLGCGTGEDAIRFAQRGHRVTAVDIASEMIGKLILKARAAGMADRIDARTADLESLEPPVERFDAIFSNFGAINCLSDLSILRDLATRALRPGGHLILVSMGGLYPLETMAFLAKGDMARAFRRFGSARSATIEGRQFPVWYYSPRVLGRTLGDRFSRTQLLGIRAFLPVPGLEHLDRYMLLRLFGRLDAAFTRGRFTAAFADHYLTIWRYKPV